MRELLLVCLSAIVGYIVFSAFSSSDTPSEAFKKIIEQPQQNKETYNKLAINKVNNTHEAELQALDNARNLDQLEVYGEIKMHDKEYETKIELKKLENQLNHKLAMLNVESKDESKNKDNATLIILALLVFLLIFIYLKHQKQLAEIELKKQEKHDELMAKKEYAERIIAYISEGNLSFETEKKLLRILDELNGKRIKPLEETPIYHPNPDILQLSNTKRN